MEKLLGLTRYVVLLGVLGTLAAAAILFLSGLLQVGKIFLQVPQYLSDSVGLKKLAIAVIQLADYFLIATALYIVSVGLYELFIGHVKLPEHLSWFRISTLDELKDRLIGVSVTVLAVTFLAIAANWTGGTDVFSFGLALAAVIIALGIFARLTLGGKNR